MFYRRCRRCNNRRCSIRTKFMICIFFFQDRNTDRRNRGDMDRRTSSREAREIPLIKLCTLRDYGLLGSRIVKLPTLISIRISNEDTLLHVRCK